MQGLLMVCVTIPPSARCAPTFLGVFSLGQSGPAMYVGGGVENEVALRGLATQFFDSSDEAVDGVVLYGLWLTGVHARRRLFCFALMIVADGQCWCCGLVVRRWLWVEEALDLAAQAGRQRAQVLQGRLLDVSLYRRAAPAAEEHDGGGVDVAPGQKLCPCYSETVFSESFRSRS